MKLKLPLSFIVNSAVSAVKKKNTNKYQLESGESEMAKKKTQLAN